MKKNEKKQKRKAAPPFEAALKTGILPSYMQCWSQERLQAVKELYEAIVGGKDAELGKIVVAGVSCGGGKSSLLKGLAVMAAERMLSLVMMTDNNKRLRDDIDEMIKRVGGEELVKIKNNIAWLSDGDAVVASEWKSVMLATLVAVSTQRYLMVNDDVRKNACTTYRMGQQTLKDVLICDEAFEDVTEKSYYYSDIKQYAGILRETIRPEREWRENIGETATRAEKYADRLIKDLQEEIERINRIQLPPQKNGLNSDGQMHIDLYMDREQRVERSGKIWKEKCLEIDSIITDIRDNIKFVKKDLRTESETILFQEIPKIQKTLENISEKTRPETILSALEQLINLTELLPIGGVRAGLKDAAVTCLDNAENYFALSELEKIVKNNRENMYQNSEHIRNRAMTAEQFLDIFRTENVVFIQSSSYGDDKEGDHSGQIRIHVFRYNFQFLPYDRIPCYLFDGTAAINPIYDNKDIFEVRQYEKPRTPVRFLQIDEKMSKTHLQDERNADRLYKNVSKFLMGRYGRKLTSKDIMISGFKSCGKYAAKYGLAEPDDYVPDGAEDKLIWNPDRLNRQTGENGDYGPISEKPYASFGSKHCTGSNDYKDCRMLCKISALRLKQSTVMGQICCRNRQFLEDLKNKDEAYRARQLQLIWAYGADRSDYADIIEDVTLRAAMTDVIQEINRLRIRNWCDNLADAEDYAIGVIWVIYGRQQGTYNLEDEDFYEKLLRKTMEYFGADVKTDYEYVTSKYNPRKKTAEKIGTLAYKIVDWYDHLPDGAEFTLADMAAGVEVDKRILRATLAKKQNYEIAARIRGENDCNVISSNRRAGYTYRKPAPSQGNVLDADYDVKFREIEDYEEKDGCSIEYIEFEKMVKDLNKKYKFSFSKPPYFIFSGNAVEMATDDGTVTVSQLDSRERYEDVIQRCEKMAAEQVSKLQREAVVTDIPDEELDSMSIDGIVDLLRKSLNQNNYRGYGECRDTAPKSIYDRMYFALYLHGDILTLRFPTDLHKRAVDTQISGRTPSAVYHDLAGYCNTIY